MSHDMPLLPLPVLREKGFAVLVRELGPAHGLRFLHLYQARTGNYTTEHEQWLGSLTKAKGVLWPATRRWHAYKDHDGGCT